MGEMLNAEDGIARRTVSPDFAAAQRRGLPWCLAQGVLNSVFYFWTFGGSVFLLFLDELGLPKGQIGFLLSLFPFCGLLALGFAPVATRLGRKRVFLAGYGLRKVAMAGLVLLPWILVQAGRTPAIVYLYGIVITFAVLRALAETAYYPWSQEFVPNEVRGTFSAWSTVLGLLASSLALLLAGHVLASGVGLNRFLWLIGLGSLLGLAGVAVMVKVPGGAPVPVAAASGAHRANLRASLRDRNFVAFLGGVGAVAVGMALLVAFLPLYLKDRLGLSAGTVVRLDALVMLGGALSSLAAGYLADRVGSRPVLMPAAALSVLLPLGWLLLPRQVPHLVVWCAALYFFYGVVSTCLVIGSGRLLFNAVVPPEKSTAYTAIYYAWIGITGGIGPLLAGGLLSLCHGWQTRLGPVVVDGHTILFMLALGPLAFGWFLFGRVKPDDIHTTRSVLRRLIVHGFRQERVKGNAGWL